MPRKLIRLSVLFIVAISIAGYAAMRLVSHAQKRGVNAAPTAAVIVSNPAPTAVDVAGTVDGNADPGDTIEWTYTLQNTGNADATGVSVSIPVLGPQTLDGTYGTGGVKVGPAAGPDTANVYGNVRISTATGAINLLANDYNPLTNSNSGLTVTAGNISSTQCSGCLNVTINADGTFTYDPPVGYTGTDTFSYTVNGPNSTTANATVTLTISGMLWFVDASATACTTVAQQCGKSAKPYSSLDAFRLENNGTALHPSDSQDVFIAENTASYTLAAALTMRTGQRYIGQDTSPNNTPLATVLGITPPTGSVTLPVTNTAGNAVTVTGSGFNVGSGDTLKGLTITNTGSTAKLSGSGIGTFTVADVTISGTGRAMSLGTGTLNGTFTSVASTSSSGTLDGMNLASLAGSVNFGSVTISGSTLQGVVINGCSFTAANFGATSVTSSPSTGISIANTTGALTFGATTVTTPTGTGIDISGSGATINFAATTVSKTAQAGTGVSLTTNSGPITFGNLAITTSNGTGLLGTNNTGTVSVTANQQAINATGGPAVNITSAATSPVSLNLGGASSTNSSTTGINLTNVTGTASLGTGAITGSAGTAFAASGGSAATSYSGTITQNNAQRVVDIQGTTGGSVTLSGTVTGGPSSTGVHIGDTTAVNGNVSFTTLNLGASANTCPTRMTNQALTIAGGTGAYSLGAVNICTTGTAEGIHSTTHATGAITISSGAVDSVGGAAINIAGTSAASRTPLNVQLTSVSANGGVKGLILSNTSASGSPGGFRVLGSGTTDGSGGTVQNTDARGADLQNVDSLVLTNMNFTSANDTTDGGGSGACDDLTITACNSAIYMSGITTLATMDNLNITGTMVENGITAIGVANLVLSNSVLSGCGNEANESCVEASNLSGTSSVTNTFITFPKTNCFDIVNTNTNLDLTLNNVQFSDTQFNSAAQGGGASTLGEGGLQFRNFGNGTANIDVLDSDFWNLRTQAIQVIGQGTSTTNVDITNNNIDSLHGFVGTPVAGGPNIGAGIDINGNDTAHVNFNVTGNPTIRSSGGDAVNITSFLGSQVMGRVNNNTVNVALIGTGVRAVAQETSHTIMEVKGNTVTEDAASNNNSSAITGQARFQSSRLDITIDGNTTFVNEPAVDDIDIIGGSSTSGETNQVYVDFKNNHASGVAGANNIIFRLRVSDLDATSDPKIFLHNFVEGGSGIEDDAIATWNAHANTPTANTVNVNVSLTGTATGIQSGVVQTPTNPLAPTIPALGENAAVTFEPIHTEHLGSENAEIALSQPASSDQSIVNSERLGSSAQIDFVAVQHQATTKDKPSLLAEFYDKLSQAIEPTAYAEAEAVNATDTTKDKPSLLAELYGKLTAAMDPTTHAQNAPDSVPTVIVNGTGAGFTLPAGASVVIKYRTTVNPGPYAAGVNTLASTETVTSTVPGGTLTPSPTVSIPLDAKPSFSMTNSDGSTFAEPGATLIYAVSTTNANIPSGQNATGVTLTMTVPANTTFNLGSSDPNWGIVAGNPTGCADGAAAATVCTLQLGALAADGNAVVKNFAVNVTGLLAGNVTQISGASSVADDGTNSTPVAPVTANNSDTDQVRGTWLGGTSIDFQNSGNWVNGTLPVAGNNISIPTVGAAANPPTLLTGGTDVSVGKVFMAKDLTLQSPRTLTVNSSIALGSNKALGGGTLKLAQGATITRSTGQVNSAMSKDFASGNPLVNAPGTPFVYPVGTGTGYYPVTAVVDTGSTGTITVQALDGNAPATPALDPLHTMQLYWTTSATPGMLADMTFAFPPPAVVPTPGTVANYKPIRVSPPATGAAQGFANSCPAGPCFDNTGKTLKFPAVSTFDASWTAGEIAAAPTAATVSVSGRVFASEGMPLRNARVVLDDGAGHQAIAITNSFGFYHFDAVESGGTYLMSAAARGYTFTPRLVTVRDSIADLDMVALP